MIGGLLELLWSFGPAVGGLAGLTYLAIWLRRLSAIATYVRVGVIVGALAIVGALVGVINVGRALELASAGWRALAGAVGVYGGMVA